MANLSVSDYNNTSTSKTNITYYLDIVSYVYVPIFVAVGVIGNSLIIRVMTSPNFSRLPVSRLLMAMSLSDLIIILLLPFNQNSLRHLLGRDIKALSEAGCKLYFWMYRFVRQTSSWIMVTISCERFVAVWMPIKAKRINTIRNAYVIITVVCIPFVVYFGYVTSLADRIINGVCIASRPIVGMEVKFRIFVGVNLLLYYFLPSNILIIVNSLIVYKLVMMKKKRQTQIDITRNTESSSGRKNNKCCVTSKTNMMLLCVTTSFVILVAPNAIFHLVSFIRKENAFESTSLLVVVLRQMAVIMEQLNHSINIVLYVLSNNRFRKELVIIVKRTNSKPNNKIELNVTGMISSVN
ncbi:hypothetical protein LSH36_87g00027 [Paralvinella palmiformis]|uniref:G-protein coupled receptors family 1 profile domain-containing protein n=1 Tax=Paralvinella palmiformis TaxID=53620 RepID=A0AAD9K144_9ANNE|nr:hypothetical protein LSH36_87g00027 [Paralvinella palmiformis]